MMLSRIGKLRETIKIDTHELRGKALQSLEQLFNLAKDLAKNEGLDLNVRRNWVQVAAYIAQVVNSVCKGFDEREIDVQLDELERLVNEAKAKTKAGKTKTRVEGKPECGSSSGPC
jgi:nitrous oxide reductase